MNAIEVDGETFSTEPYTSSTKETNPYTNHRLQRELKLAQRCLTSKKLKYQKEDFDFTIPVNQLPEVTPQP